MTDKDKTLDEFIKKMLSTYHQYHEPPEECCYDAEELKPILMTCVEKGKSLGYDEGYAKGCEDAQKQLGELPASISGSKDTQQAYVYGVKIGKQAGRDEIIGKRLVCARKQNGQIHGEPLEYCHKCVSNTDFLYEKIAALEKENAELKATQKPSCKCYEELYHSHQELKSENKRLRSALEKILESKSFSAIQYMAEKALTGDKQ